MQYTYPATLTEDLIDGGYVVTCRDIPEAITQGDTIEEALAASADALDEAICGYINHGRDIPEPSAKQAGEHLVSVPVSDGQEIRKAKRQLPDTATALRISGSCVCQTEDYPLFS